MEYREALMHQSVSSSDASNYKSEVQYGKSDDDQHWTMVQISVPSGIATV